MAEKVEQTFLVVTANRLEDGRVVYLRADRTWAAELDDADLLTDAVERDARIAWAAREQSLLVTGCYGFELGVAASGARVLSTREQLRAAGEASVRRRLGLER